MSNITTGISTAITLAILGFVTYTAGSMLQIKAEKAGFDKREELAVMQIKAAYQAGMNMGASQCPRSRPNRASEADIYAPLVYPGYTNP